MPYTLSGTINTPVRILVIKQSDWSISHNTLATTNYSINTTSGDKLVIARSTATGQALGYGNITPNYILDVTPPTIVITTPTSGTTYATPSATITLQGTATDDESVSSVKWRNATTTISGNSTGTASWQSSAISLNIGSNTLNVYAIDPTGNTGSDTITVTRNGDRGVFPGGGNMTSIDYVAISVNSNAANFGTMSRGIYEAGTTSNGITGRGIIGGGAGVNNIDYITIMSPGNSQDFGDLKFGASYQGCTSNNTNNRGVFAGYQDNSKWTEIDYITISTLGNAQDFGQLTIGRNAMGGTSNGTNNRGIFTGGRFYNYTEYPQNVIDYITINSAGNAADFGDLTSPTGYTSSSSNLTNNRGVTNIAWMSSGHMDLCYNTISTLGNAADFGNLLVRMYKSGFTSNGVHNKGVLAGGSNGNTNVIQYITITSTGNSQDFGDLTSIYRSELSALSNA